MALDLIKLEEKIDKRLAEDFPSVESIHAKAWELDLSKIEEGYLYSEVVVYAETRNKAKTLMLAEGKYENWSLKYSDDEISYLNIPIKRCKQCDKVMFKGELLTNHQIEDRLANEKRNSDLDEILNNPSIEYCYILKGSYYRPHSCGYTSHKYEAGVYPKAEAVSHARSVRDIVLVRVDKAEHNKMVEEKISDLKRQLIN